MYGLRAGILALPCLAMLASGTYIPNDYIPNDLVCEQVGHVLATIVHVHHLVAIQSQFDTNQTYTINGGVTIDITNAPTFLSTEAIGTHTKTILNDATE